MIYCISLATSEAQRLQDAPLVSRVPFHMCRFNIFIYSVTVLAFCFLEKKEIKPTFAASISIICGPLVPTKWETVIIIRWTMVSCGYSVLNLKTLAAYCLLFTKHSLDERPKYLALSYVWGSLLLGWQVSFNGYSSQIGNNLYIATN